MLSDMLWPADDGVLVLLSVPLTHTSMASDPYAMESAGENMATVQKPWFPLRQPRRVYCVKQHGAKEY